MNIKNLIAGAVLAGAAATCAHAGGSLIDPERYRGPAADRRAGQVGDLLTVVVLESNRASSQASTGAANDVRVGLEYRNRGGGRAVSGGVTGESNGRGGTTRAGDVRAQLSVRVESVADNGQLFVAGEQSIVVNGETQRIRLSGWVRPEDIAATNSVLSSRLADASIELTGEGVVSEAQRRSVVYRVMKWLGLL